MTVGMELGCELRGLGRLMRGVTPAWGSAGLGLGFRV